MKILFYVAATYVNYTFDLELIMSPFAVYTFLFFFYKNDKKYIYKAVLYLVKNLNVYAFKSMVIS